MFYRGYTNALLKLGFQEKAAGRLADAANAMAETSAGGSRVLRTPNPIHLKPVPDIFNVTPKPAREVAKTVVEKITPSNNLRKGLLLGGGAAAAVGGGLLLHKLLKSRKPVETPAPNYEEYDYQPNDFVYGNPLDSY
jgi:hypothetical protein